ncbi:hypothetical protein SBA2_570002 [Acidobacteriia bacterium SbA2]|nr:hypothetical protein SBA2_570002 [Acidobacteriia bacterium SbA2]
MPPVKSQIQPYNNVHGDAERVVARNAMVESLGRNVMGSRNSGSMGNCRMPKLIVDKSLYHALTLFWM